MTLSHMQKIISGLDVWCSSTDATTLLICVCFRSGCRRDDAGDCCWFCCLCVVCFVCCYFCVVVDLFLTVLILFDVVFFVGVLFFVVCCCCCLLSLVYSFSW